MSRRSLEVSSMGSFLSAAPNIAKARQKRTTHFMKYPPLSNYTAGGYWAGTVTARIVPPGGEGSTHVQRFWCREPEVHYIFLRGADAFVRAGPLVRLPGGTAPT